MPTLPASPLVEHILISHAFTPGLVHPVLTQFSDSVCSLVISLPHHDLERFSNLLSSLEGGATPHALGYMCLNSTIAVIPLPPWLTCHLVHLKTLVLHNILPTWRPLETLSALTTLSLVGDPQSPVYEYRISEFFELLLCTPRLRHLRLARIGPSIYDITPDWVVPLEHLKTLHLHHCQLRSKILCHLSVPLDLEEVSIHAHVQSTEAALHPTSRRPWFIPFRADIYQEGQVRCQLMFVGTCLLKDSWDRLTEFPASTLELTFTNTTRGSNPTFSDHCIQSFHPLPTMYIQELTIHSYRRPRRQARSSVHDLLRSLVGLRKLVLKGCDEEPFYEALGQDRVNRRCGKRRAELICPHLIRMEINPVFKLFQSCLGDRVRCPRLMVFLAKLLRTREQRGAPLERLELVFPARCKEEARYIEKKWEGSGTRVVRVGVSSG